MIITEAILDAQSTHAVYFLLTCYIEAVTFHPSKHLPGCTARLPLLGLRDVAARYSVLRAKLEEATRVGSGSITPLKEAAEVFGSATRQLRKLEGRYINLARGPGAADVCSSDTDRIELRRSIHREPKYLRNERTDKR